MFVLASASPQRLGLLQQIDVEPDCQLRTDIDESHRKGETPAVLSLRLAREKACFALKKIESETRLEGSRHYILAADTVVAVGRRVLGKPKSEGEAAVCLALLSGRAHRVFTSVCLIVSGQEGLKTKLVETRLCFKRFSEEDIRSYIASGEWRDKAGGYAVQGVAGSFVIKLIGSYSNVVGLPLYETKCLLEGTGYFGIRRRSV